MKTRQEIMDEFDDWEPKRREYYCSDGMCGALDCRNCHPCGQDEEEDEKALAGGEET